MINYAGKYITLFICLSFTQQILSQPHTLSKEKVAQLKTASVHWTQMSGTVFLTEARNLVPKEYQTVLQNIDEARNLNIAPHLYAPVIHAHRSMIQAWQLKKITEAIEK